MIMMLLLQEDHRHTQEATLLPSSPLSASSYAISTPSTPEEDTIHCNTKSNIVAYMSMLEDAEHLLIDVELGSISGVFGCKEVSESKEMGKNNCSLPYLSKHRKRKIRKSLFLFSFLFYTTIFSLPECYS